MHWSTLHRGVPGRDPASPFDRGSGGYISRCAQRGQGFLSPYMVTTSERQGLFSRFPVHRQVGLLRPARACIESGMHEADDSDCAGALLMGGIAAKVVSELRTHSSTAEQGTHNPLVT